MVFKCDVTEMISESESIHAVKVHLKTSANSIQITWQNGVSTEITGERLRQYCACAACRSRQHVGYQLISNITEIKSLAPMGSSGLQITFADGHDRGIFPWSYLHAIAEGKAKDFLNE